MFAEIKKTILSTMLVLCIAPTYAQAPLTPPAHPAPPAPAGASQPDASYGGLTIGALARAQARMIEIEALGALKGTVVVPASMVPAAPAQDQRVVKVEKIEEPSWPVNATVLGMYGRLGDLKAEVAMPDGTIAIRSVGQAFGPWRVASIAGGKLTLNQGGASRVLRSGDEFSVEVKPERKQSKKK